LKLKHYLKNGHQTGEQVETNFYQRLREWQPPQDWQRIVTFDTHTGGEPLRIILAGFPELTGKTVLERRQSAREKYDHLRTALMWEPRGHADMYGAIITPPVNPGSDFSVLFIHNEGYSTMCGHATIALAKVAVETGIKNTGPETVIRMDTPSGTVTAIVSVSDSSVSDVRFRNVASFVAEHDALVVVPGIGKITYDLAFGGAYYAFVDARPLGLDLVPEQHGKLIEVGMRIKRAVMAEREMGHPYEPDLNFLYGTIFTGPAKKKSNHSRNVCIFAEGEVDRSPTGTGVSARMAIHYARGEVALKERITIESILGSEFTGSVFETTKFGPYAAVIPEVSGSASITGRHEFFIDPEDPFQKGFILR
jgi:proline racemase